MSKPIQLKNYELACLQLATKFINDFHKSNGDMSESEQEVLYRFVGNDPTDFFEFADLFLSISDIVEFYRTGATFGEFSGWYWENIESDENTTKIDLKHYLQIVRPKSKKTK